MPNPAHADSRHDWLLALVDSTREFAILFVDASGIVIGWQGASEMLFGYTADEAVGMPFSRLFTESDVALGLDRTERDIAWAGGRSEDDRWHVRKNGGRFWGSGVMEPVRDAEGRIVAVAKTVRDRTDVRAHVATLQNRVTEFEHSTRQLRESMTSFAHEFRNQLLPLANLVALMARSPESSPPARSLHTMQRKIDVMSQLLGDVLNAARERPDALSVEFEDVVVQDAVQRAADSASADIQRRRQDLRIVLPSGPIVMQADPERLDQMLVNLLGNASKFTPDGGTIRLSATVEDDMVAIRVEDDGIGISPEMLPRIFDLFTREGAEGAPEGMGVGLAVVKQLATLHAGFVEGRSPGRDNGSVFTLRLPLRQPKDSA